MHKITIKIYLKLIVLSIQALEEVKFFGYDF